MKKIISFVMVITAALLLASCTREYAKHDIYVTVYPLKYISDELLLGTDYTVGIVPGVTSHEHSAEWAPKQIIAMKEAQLLFYIGANYDQYIDKKLSVFDNANVSIIKIEDQKEFIQYIPGMIHSHDHDDNETEHGTTLDDKTSLGTDPHFWTSPKRMLDVLELFYHYFTVNFPDENTLLETNYILLKEKLELLHQDYTTIIANMNRPALTSTNLFGYLREDYNFRFIPISDGYHEEPDSGKPGDTKIIMGEIEFHHITKIIYEKQRSSPMSDNIFAQMQIIYPDIETEKLQFNILQALRDEDIKNGIDYIVEMRSNLETFKKAGK